MLTARQFLGWFRYFSLEPWGFPVEDARYAIQQAVICRVAGSKEVTPQDFSMEQKPPEDPDVAMREADRVLGIVDDLPPQVHAPAEAAKHAEAGDTARVDGDGDEAAP